MTGSTIQSLAAAFTGLWLMSFGAAATLADANGQEVRILIKAREFRPSQVTLRVGRETVLVFENHDAEIHSFVHEGLLDDISVTIEGSGAPIFEGKGLKLVLIPGGGRTEIRFVPRSPGEYQYRCDMPGHQMAGRVVVMEEVRAPRTVQAEQQESLAEGGIYEGKGNLEP